MPAIFKSVLASSITPYSFFICLFSSVLIGLAVALVYIKTEKRYSSGFVVTLALLPAVVQIIIMMVNGNLGAGVAVAGAFSLVRFRSIPGTAKEIGAIFIALAAGLATGMGYIAFAAIFALVMLLLMLVYSALKLGARAAARKKELTVVIPENLNYTAAFNDLFEKYTDYCELISVKTTNMGSLFKLKYEIRLKSEKEEKEFIDSLRCRNGNLEIMCCRLAENGENL
ncbi:MAG: DUF4956 domain-containing protein [Oscillospiraceae bacterium]|nr:DUF4956 domain-containing protein [Oscillospiraceae bacterium]MDD7293286.1 DUF4956 domain-containing protein [Clostridiaceae bacterium]MDY5990852.1 DUF4956 domain-containing protein [Oscillospiraceae bacterium]